MQSFLFILSILLAILVSVHSVCKTADYCPGGWNVLRKPDGSPHTCNIMAGITKCPKPYSCVHSKCDMDFCCSHAYKIEQFKKQKEVEQDIKEAEMEDEEQTEL